MVFSAADPPLTVDSLAPGPYLAHIPITGRPAALPCARRLSLFTGP